MILPSAVRRICHLFNPRTALALVAIGLLVVGVFGMMRSGPAVAAAGINKTISFQGRLLTASGAVVADGDYNMRFKIYQDGNGVLGGGDETLKWTETRQNSASQGVTVKNGYFSVRLGEITAFGGSVDWNQDTLWLSMDVAGTGTGGSPTYDGEMSPFKRLSSAVYALQADNAGTLGGLSSSQFIQNVAPNASQQTANINILSGAAANVAAAQIQTVASATAPVLVLKGGATPGSGADLLQLQDSSANITSGFDSTGQLYLGRASGLTGIAKFYNSGNTGSISVTPANPGASNYTLTLPAETGTLCSTASVCSGYQASATAIVQAPGSTAQNTIAPTTNSVIALTVKATSGTAADILNLQTSGGTNVATVDSLGHWAIQNRTTNSTSAFVVKSTGGTDELVVDTTNDRVGIKRTSPTATLDVNGDVLINGTALSSNVALVVKGASLGSGHVLDVYDTQVVQQLQAYFDSTGSLNVSKLIQPTANNSLDLGLSGTTFRTGYFGTSVVTPAVSSTGTLSVTSGGSGALTLTSAASASWTVGGTNQSLTVTTSGTGTLTLGTTGAGTVKLGDTSSTTISIGAGSNIARTINIGNAGTSQTQTINIGSTSSASTVTVQAGTGGLSLTTQGTGTLGVGNNAVAQTIAVGNSTGATSVAVSCGTGACGFGNNATDHSTTAGSTTGTSLTTLQGGTGGVNLSSTGNITIGTSDTTGTLLVLDTKTSFTSGAQVGDPTGVAGGMYYNSATGAFRCYDVDHWRDCMESIRTSYHYSNDMQGVAADNVIEFDPGATGGVDTLPGETGRPGINLLQTLTTSSGVGGAIVVRSNGNYTIRLGNNDYWRFEGAVRIRTASGLSDGTNRYTARIGFLNDATTGDGTNGCFFRYTDNVNSGKWQGVCRSASTESTCDTTTTVAVDTWYRNTVVVNAAGTSVDFQINGVSKCQVTTNIPTGSTNQTNWGASIAKGLGSTNRELDIDYIDVKGELGTAR